MSRSWISFLVAVTLHVVVLALVKGASITPSRFNVKGLQLPPLSVELIIQPPELSTKEKAAGPKHDNADEMPRMPTMPDAPRLLTPPPVPVEQINEMRLVTPSQHGVLEKIYFPSSVLTIHPKPNRDPKIELPSGWLEAFGQTALTIYINEDGGVDKVVLGKTNLPPLLQKEVQKAFESIQFSPGEIEGTPVPSMMRIEADVSAPLGRRR